MGFGRVAALELPTRWGGLIDLPAVLDEHTGGLLAPVLTGTEDQVAVRSSGVYGRRLIRAGTTAKPTQDTNTTTSEVRLRGLVLITGGTGYLGGKVARWAVARGAEHVLLLSRRGPQAPGAAGLREELAGLGARVTVVACDVADRAALARVLAEVPADCPLTAVVHAAGIGHPHTPVERLDPAQLDAVVRAKMTSAWHLHELTAGLALEAFVLFSSGAASWGSGGQGAYAAANAFLDGLAQYRQGVGLVATSLAWGVWAGSGMGADTGLVEGFGRRGVLPMEPDLALAVLERAVCEGSVTLTVTNTDWDRFASSFTVERPSPLLSDIAEVREALTRPGPGLAGEPVLRQRLMAMGEKDQARMVLGLVRRGAALTLGFDNPDALPPGRVFRDAGFDSLTAVELRGKLTRATGLALPASLVFDYPTPTVLADHLRRQLLGTRPDPAVPVLAAAQMDEPIAIVGLGCRFPGGVDSPQQLWALLAGGVDAVSAFPTQRGWDPIGDGYARVGGFIEDVAGFDAGFFGISPREALAMDPQQRLLLETAWEALERAGIDPNVVAGQQNRRVRGRDRPGLRDLAGGCLGGHRRLPADRQRAAVCCRAGSRTCWGWKGPAVTVDTACSSSLVALHLARCRRCGRASARLALAGGVTVMATPGVFVEFGRQRGLAADGRCKAFAGGGGRHRLGRRRRVWCWWSGCRDAQRNGHRVLAVVRGSAVNQDGASNGLTAPNGPVAAAGDPAGAGQRRADARRTSMWWRRTAPGPRLGDPIEAQALLATYGQDRPGAAAVARVGQVQHRPHPGRRRRRRRDQDGAGDAARPAAADAARGRAVRRTSTGPPARWSC